MLVRFEMKVSEGEDEASLDARWQRIYHNTLGVSLVCKTTAMSRYEGEFRVDGEAALEALRREGIATLKQ